MKKTFSFLFALVLVCSFSLVTAVPAAAVEPETVVLGGDVATAVNAQGSSDEQNIGSGSWQAIANTKMELYIDPTSAPFDILGSFTIADIDSISYVTKNSGTPANVDFGLNIYTVPYAGGDASWYGNRLSAEPLYSYSYNPTIDEWNTWNTDSGDNQLQFFDSNHTVAGFYTGPTLTELQAGVIDWGTYPNSGSAGDPTLDTIDYSSQTVKYIVFVTSTGGNWATFDGFLDAMTINLTTGPSLTIDLEEYYNEVWVDDDAAMEWYALPGNFDNIQDGIDAVAEAGMVNVVAGNYAGAIVDKDVTISGAEGGASVINTGVLYKAGSGLTTAFRLDAGADGTEISDFTINCDVNTSFNFAIFARTVDDVTIDSLEINDTVQGISNWGGSGWTVTNNTITDTVAAGGGGIGIFLGALNGPSGYGTCCDNLVQYNTIDASATAEDYSCPAICLSLDLRYGGYLLVDGSEDISGNQILDNTITASAANNLVGIEVGVIGSEGDPGKIAAIMTAAAVHDNTVQDNSVDGADIGIYLYNVTDLTVNQNTVQNNVGYGIYGEHGQSGTVITGNTFTDNEVQLTDETVDTGTLDPLDIATILNNNTFDRAVTVDHPGASLLHSIWSSIQDAIDAAVAGDTINVAAGIYHEDLAGWKDMEITKSVSLIGAGSGSTIVELSEGNGLGGKMNGLEIRGSNLDVVLQGITFTKTPGNTYATSYPIRVAETTSTFSKLTFKDVEVAYAEAPNVCLEEGTFDEVYIEDCYFHHAGTWGFLSGGTVNKITVINSDFEYNGQVDPDHGNGFDLSGPASTNVLVEGGSFNYNTQAGINLMRVSDAIFRGVVANNNAGASGGGFGIKLDEWGGKSHDILFENCTATGNALDGITIQPEKDDAIEHVRIVGATLTDNGRNGLNLCYVYSGSNNPEMHDVSISFSDIHGNAGYGVQVWSWWVPMVITELFDATNNWWGDVTGPSHDLNLGGQGDAVSDNVDFSPWLYKTQEQFVSDAPCYAGSVVLENEATEVEAGSYAGGWNSFSTPITLDDSADYVSELLALTKGSGLVIERAQRWDLATQKWVAVIMGNVVEGEDYQIKPGEGLFIQVSSKGSLPILVKTTPTSPPMRNLLAGWNLVGLSNLTSMSVANALHGVDYSVVLSPKPPNDVAWSVPPDGAAEELLLGEAYWVAMGEPGILFGFTTTPMAVDMTWELNQNK